MVLKALEEQHLAFAHCIFTNFRVPPLITVILESLLFNCRSMFSLELPTIISEILDGAFGHCYCLRNVAFPTNVVIGYDIFIYGQDDKEVHTDLLQLFGSEVAIISALQHRFDELPIHSLVYYQSYNQQLT
jgi:hypothetical protein